MMLFSEKHSEGNLIKNFSCSNLASRSMGLYQCLLRIKTRFFKYCFFLLLNIFFVTATAQNERAQLPRALSKAYFEFNIGSINYPFSQNHLEEGFIFHSVQIPHAAVRLVLFGYDFNKSLSGRITYMRPILWLKYQYQYHLDGRLQDEILGLTVWMNYVSFSLKYKYSLSDHLSVYAEGGYTIVTRNGYTGWYGTVVKNSKYNTYVVGGGLTYHLNDKWGLSLSATYSPENKKEKQPHTTFVSTGFSYHLQPYDKRKLEKTANSGFIYPKQMIRIGFTSNVFGYDANNFFEKIYLFWGGDAEVRKGISINYQRNIFHAAKVFSMDWGINLSLWQSDMNKENFFTLSVYPVLRFNFLRCTLADAYFFYSIAGPTYISKIIIDGNSMGSQFTFQDNMGIGMFLGKHRNYNVEVKIGHYSNGNIFPTNEGVKIPLTLNLGVTF